MDWASRVKIAIGSAKGLAYLHEDCKCVYILYIVFQRLFFMSDLIVL